MSQFRARANMKKEAAARSRQAETAARKFHARPHAKSRSRLAANEQSRLSASHPKQRYAAASVSARKRLRQLNRRSLRFASLRFGMTILLWRQQFNFYTATE